MKSIPVALGDRSYPIFIGQGILDHSADISIDQYIKGQQVCIVTNETIAPLYLDQVKRLLEADCQVETVILPDGEQYKNLDTLNRIFTKLLESRHNRTTTLLALGGGVVGDITGFAAASYQRGVNFIQMPTTLLSQVDSSVGGKTGVNHPLGKNMIGAFKQPEAVLIDISSLDTLPDEELSAGLAEVIKYGFIWDDRFLSWLEDNMAKLVARDKDALIYAISRSCEIKADVVAKDETEQNIRALLNLGHTFGHAIEAYAGYGQWLHGQAVGCGMLMAATMSEQLGWLTSAEVDRCKQLILAAGLPIKPPSDMTADDFMVYMAVDKKNVNNRIRLVLLKDLGKAVVTQDYPDEVLASVLNGFCTS